MERITELCTALMDCSTYFSEEHDSVEACASSWATDFYQYNSGEACVQAYADFLGCVGVEGICGYGDTGSYSYYEYYEECYAEYYAFYVECYGEFYYTDYYTDSDWSGYDYSDYDGGFDF